MSEGEFVGTAQSITSGSIVDGEVSRADLNTSTSGQAVVTRIIAGTGVTLGSTGADSGTGDVTINTAGGGITFNVDRTGDGSITGLVNGANSVFVLSGTPITDSLHMKHNGLDLEEIQHYTRVGATVTMTTAPASGDRLVAYYAT